jgi:hypothetical protein
MTLNFIMDHVLLRIKGAWSCDSLTILFLGESSLLTYRLLMKKTLTSWCGTYYDDAAKHYSIRYSFITMGFQKGIEWLGVSVN